MSSQWRAILVRLALPCAVVCCGCMAISVDMRGGRYDRSGITSNGSSLSLDGKLVSDDYLRLSVSVAGNRRTISSGDPSFELDFNGYVSYSFIAAAGMPVHNWGILTLEAVCGWTPKTHGRQQGSSYASQSLFTGVGLYVPFLAFFGGIAWPESDMFRLEEGDVVRVPLGDDGPTLVGGVMASFGALRTGYTVGGSSSGWFLGATFSF